MPTLSFPMPSATSTATKRSPNVGPAQAGPPAEDRALVRKAAAALSNWIGTRTERQVRAGRRSGVAPIARPVAVRPRVRARFNAPAKVEMPVGIKWQRVADVIERAIQRGDRAAELHAAAQLRIDSAEYEIGLLKHDLEGVLSRYAGAKA